MLVPKDIVRRFTPFERAARRAFVAVLSSFFLTKQSTYVYRAFSLGVLGGGNFDFDFSPSTELYCGNPPDNRWAFGFDAPLITNPEQEAGRCGKAGELLADCSSRSEDALRESRRLGQGKQAIFSASSAKRPEASTWWIQ